MPTQTPPLVLRFQDCGNENWEFYHDHDKSLRFSITAFSDQIIFRHFQPCDSTEASHTFIKMENGSPTRLGSNGITAFEPLWVDKSNEGKTWSIEFNGRKWDIVTAKPGEGAVQDVTIWVRDIMPTVANPSAAEEQEPAGKLAGKFTGNRLEIVSDGYVICTMFATLAFLKHPLYSSYHDCLKRTVMLPKTPRLVLKFRDCGNENWEFHHDHDEDPRFSITTVGDQLIFREFRSSSCVGVCTRMRMENGFPTIFKDGGVGASVPLEEHQSDEINTCSIELNGCKWDIATATPGEGVVQNVTVWVSDIMPTANASAANKPAKKLAGKLTHDRMEIFSGNYATCTMLATLVFLKKIHRPDNVTGAHGDSAMVNNPESCD